VAGHLHRDAATDRQGQHRDRRHVERELGLRRLLTTGARGLVGSSRGRAGRERRRERARARLVVGGVGAREAARAGQGDARHRADRAGGTLRHGIPAAALEAEALGAGAAGRRLGVCPVISAT
jgi:hypothetical protein